MSILQRLDVPLIDSVPSTRAVNINEDTLKQLNRVAFSPEKQILDVTDSAAITPEILQQYRMIGYMNYNITSPHTVYAFDVSASGNSIGNRRPIYLIKQ